MNSWNVRHGSNPNYKKVKIKIQKNVEKEERMNNNKTTSYFPVLFRVCLCEWVCVSIQTGLGLNLHHP